MIVVVDVVVGRPGEQGLRLLGVLHAAVLLVPRLAAQLLEAGLHLAEALQDFVQAVGLVAVTAVRTGSRAWVTGFAQVHQVIRTAVARGRLVGDALDDPA